MGQLTTRLRNALDNRIGLRRWNRLADAVPTTELTVLRQQRQTARALRAALDRLIRGADRRLMLPRVGSNAFTRPGGTLWAWRPDLWRAELAERGIASPPTRTQIGPEVELFHDCPRSEITLRQVRNLREEDLAPYGLQLEVYGFSGSFLSLAVGMPPEAVAGMQRRHLIRMAAIIEMEKPLELFARLNVRHGPNTEQVVLEVPARGGEVVVEFDLAYSQVNDKRIERMWLDLIFEGPEMNQIIIRDLNFCRYPRAEL